MWVTPVSLLLAIGAIFRATPAAAAMATPEGPGYAGRGELPVAGNQVVVSRSLPPADAAERIRNPRLPLGPMRVAPTTRVAQLPWSPSSGGGATLGSDGAYRIIRETNLRSAVPP